MTDIQPDTLRTCICGEVTHTQECDVKYALDGRQRLWGGVRETKLLYKPHGHA